MKSWVHRKVPDKVIFFSITGKKHDFIHALKTHINILVSLIQEYDFIEVRKTGIRLPFENDLPYQQKQV